MASIRKAQHVPIAAQSHDHSAHLAGVPMERFFSDPIVFVRAQLLVSEYYGFDAPCNMWDVYNIEAEAMGQRMAYSPGRIPDVDFHRPLLSEPSKLDHIRPPDPRSSGRMPWVHRINRLFMEFTGSPARGYFCAPFSLAVNIRGYANLVMDMKLRPAFAHRLLSFLCDEVLAPYIRAMRQESGAPNLVADGMDAWASPPNVSLNIMDEFVIPYVERLRVAAGGTVVTSGNWGESKSHDPERFMAQKLKACPISLRVFDPDLYALGPRRIKEFALEHKSHITAGLDAQLIRNGPAEDIVGRIRHYIDVMARDGRFVLYLNQIPMDTPSHHIWAAVAACHTYGQFPIAANLDEVEVRIPEQENFPEFLRRKGESLSL